MVCAHSRLPGNPAAAACASCAFYLMLVSLRLLNIPGRAGSSGVAQVEQGSRIRAVRENPLYFSTFPSMLGYRPMNSSLSPQWLSVPWGRIGGGGNDLPTIHGPCALGKGRKPGISQHLLALGSCLCTSLEQEEGELLFAQIQERHASFSSLPEGRSVCLKSSCWFQSHQCSVGVGSAFPAPGSSELLGWREGRRAGQRDCATAGFSLLTYSLQVL